MICSICQQPCEENPCYRPGNGNAEYIHSLIPEGHGEDDDFPDLDADHNALPSS